MTPSRLIRWTGLAAMLGAAVWWTVLLAAGTFVASVVAVAQVAVGPGQTWSFEFTSLPFLGSVPLSSPIDGFGGASIFFTVTPASRYSYKLDTFQNSLSELPVMGYLQDYSIEGSGRVGGYGIWGDDLQGWIQLHISSGELVVTQIQFDVFLRPAPPASWLDHYQAVFTVTAPVLSFTLSTNLLGTKQLILAWPTNAVAYTLQASASIDSGPWNNVTNAPSVVGSQYSVAVDVNNSQRIFRLQNK